MSANIRTRKFGAIAHSANSEPLQIPNSHFDFYKEVEDSGELKCNLRAVLTDWEDRLTLLKDLTDSFKRVILFDHPEKWF